MVLHLLRGRVQCCSFLFPHLFAVYETTTPTCLALHISHSFSWFYHSLFTGRASQFQCRGTSHFMTSQQVSRSAPFSMSAPGWREVARQMFSPQMSKGFRGGSKISTISIFAWIPVIYCRFLNKSCQQEGPVIVSYHNKHIYICINLYICIYCCSCCFWSGKWCSEQNNSGRHICLRGSLLKKWRINRFSTVLPPVPRPSPPIHFPCTFSPYFLLGVQTKSLQNSGAQHSWSVTNSNTRSALVRKIAEKDRLQNVSGTNCAS